MSIRLARRQSPASIAMRWCKACARMATAMLLRSTGRRYWRNLSSLRSNRATMSSAWAPARSRNGPMSCRPNLQRSGRGNGVFRSRAFAQKHDAGTAQLLFMPEDEADLGYFLAHLPDEFAVTVIGLGSNLIVRDGGVRGAVVRLGRGFNGIAVEGTRIRAGAAVPDVKVARTAQEAGIGGLSFMRGIPGAIGGALRMNGGAYGRETKDVLVEARAVDRRGRV